ncbi:MAG: site-2 protease family protein [Planctomycetes bacterium]|nr:site-2 protease family protein [Planctomycetota bacterium]
MDSQVLVDRVIWFVPFLLSLTVHEWAHAWMANRLGDDTARMMGRMTLDPIAHIDPVGTIILPLFGVPFGWAKPVPVNPIRFHSSVSLRMGILLVAAAGPLSNLAIAFLAWTALYAFPESNNPLSNQGVVVGLVTILFPLNLGLCLFNLIPIPPLDGSKIVDCFVPDSLRPAWNWFCRLGPVSLIGLIVIPSLFGFSPIGIVLEQVRLWITV